MCSPAAAPSAWVKITKLLWLLARNQSRRALMISNTPMTSFAGRDCVLAISAEADADTARLYVNGGPGWYGAGWYWDPWFSAYTFIPGAGIFYSPFGWGFYSPVRRFTDPRSSTVDSVTATTIASAISTAPTVTASNRKAASMAQSVGRFPRRRLRRWRLPWWRRRRPPLTVCGMASDHLIRIATARPQLVISAPSKVTRSHLINTSGG